MLGPKPEELLEKDHAVFDQITNEICDLHLKDFCINGEPVIVRRRIRVKERGKISRSF